MSALTLAMLQGKTTAEKLELAGAFAGTTGSVLDGIWNTESSRGEAMVSPAGARGHFGLMPATAATWSQRLGFEVNPDDFDQSLIAAASTLKENMGRFGNLPDALRAYNGGWERSRWNNEETRAYVQKVMGSEAPTVTEVAQLPAITAEQLLGMSSSDITLVKPAGDEAATGAKQYLNAWERREAFRNAVTGGEGFQAETQDPTLNRQIHSGLQDLETEQHSREAEVTMRDGVSWAKKLAASLEENSLTMMAVNAIDREEETYDPGFDYMANMDALETGLNFDERHAMRQAVSLPDAERILEDLMKSRTHIDTYGGLDGGSGLMYGLIGGVLDPAGFLAGAGVGKGFELAGVGSRALIQAGRPIAAAASTVAEGAIGNVAVTGALDGAGDYVSPEDYASSAAFGLGIGAVMAPFTFRSGVKSNDLERQARVLAAASAEREAEVVAKATVAAGPGATPEVIAAKATEIRTQEMIAQANVAFAPVDEFSRFLGAEGDLLTADPVVKERVIREYGLDAASDQSELGIIAEYYARAERFTQANPVGATPDGILTATGQESAGYRMLRSQDPLMRMVAQNLVEGTTGAGGRRHTAALTQALRERIYNAPLREVDDLFDVWRKANGRGFWTEAMGGTGRRDFDKAIAVEMHNRGKEGFKSEAPRPVQRAADIYAAGYERMGIDQQVAQTVGAARITPGEASYFPQRISGIKITQLTNAQRKTLSKIISVQVADRYGWDAAFSDTFGTKYIERGIDRAKGAYDVPVNLNSPDAGGIVEDILEAMSRGLKGPALERMEAMTGKFSRGGASFTKHRTDLDLTQVYKSGNESFTLLDIMDTDMMGLYRSYARRASGDVALAQFGIAGDKGLKLLRKAMQVGGKDGKRATVEELESFDQIAAEMLNQPFGKHHGNFMDNTRLATSLTRLGGMGFTQLGEYGNGIAALGVHRVFAAIKDMPRLLKEVGELRDGKTSTSPILGSLESGFGGDIGLDDYRNSRMFDVKDNEVQLYGRETIGLGTKLIRSGAHLQSIVSFQRPLTAVQTRGMAEQIVQKAMRFIKEGRDDVALKDMGFTPELQAAIKRNLGAMVEFDAKGRVKSLDIFKGDLTNSQRRDIIDTVNRGAHQIIQRTYIGETGKWAHNGLLKLLFQFRTFGLTAAEKQWGRNRANFGAVRSAGLLLGSMSFAAPIYLARVHIQALGMNESGRKEYLDKMLTPQAIARATMNYASSSGFLPDILDLAGGTVSGVGSNFVETKEGSAKFAESIGARGGGKGKLLGGAIAPGIGQLEDAWSVAHGDVSKLQGITPGANLPYLQWFFNMLENKEE